MIKEQIKAHAIAEYPKESCGFVVGDTYYPQENVSPEPERCFEINPTAYLALGGCVDSVVHSHPDGPIAPSARDMRCQIDMAVPWGILITDGQGVSDPYWFGEGITAPLVGRSFRHGPTGTDGKGDCYALIKDYFLLKRGVSLLEFPRDDEWWINGGDLYEDGFGKAGFVETDAPQPGDVFFMNINSSVPNHAGILLENNLILHHLANRLSRREPLGRWVKFVTKWVRHVD